LLKSKRFVLFMFIENVNLISSILLKGVFCLRDLYYKIFIVILFRLHKYIIGLILDNIYIKIYHKT